MSDPSKSKIIAEKVFAVVIWFDSKKCYGFGRVENSTMDLFLHFKNIKTLDYYRELKAGQRILCDVLENHKGLTALNIEPLGHVVHVYATQV